MAEGAALTVTTAVTEQPRAEVYFITDVPFETPETMPVPEPTEAMAVVPLLQEPPAVLSDSVVRWPVQIPSIPVMPAGNGLTVMILVLVHPDPSE